MKRLGLPEILLLPLIAAAFLLGSIVMGFMLVISWMLHVWLRNDPQFPSFGSLFHVLITIGSCLVYLYTTGILNEGVRGIKEPANVGEAASNVVETFGLETLYGLPAFAAGCVFVGAQLLFWTVAVRKIRRRLASQAK